MVSRNLRTFDGHIRSRLIIFIGLYRSNLVNNGHILFEHLAEHGMLLVEVRRTANFFIQINCLLQNGFLIFWNPICIDLVQCVIEGIHIGIHLLLACAGCHLVIHHKRCLACFTIHIHCRHHCFRCIIGYRVFALYNEELAAILSLIHICNLSGTCNVMKILGDAYHGLECHVLDTKNISIGSGFLALRAAQYLEHGMCWQELLQKLPLEVPNSRVFFCVKSLEYLQKGGRIGLVAAAFGTALNLKPIISCNSDGIYYTAGKALGLSLIHI